MAPLRFFSALTVVAILAGVDLSEAQDVQRPLRSASGKRPGAAEHELLQSRADVIQKIKETRAGAEKLLALHEAERLRALEEYNRRRDLYDRGLISRSDVLRAEEVLARAIMRVEEDKRWLVETDTVLTEYAMRDELLRLPALAVGGYAEDGTLLRFNGGGFWSVAEASKIEAFFRKTFGKALPISALGQTATHDRLRFDHRDAIDVALHPDSQEGRSLLSFLRQSGIPFLAFRGAVVGSSTGAHIHIGKPSARY